MDGSFDRRAARAAAAAFLACAAPAAAAGNPPAVAAPVAVGAAVTREGDGTRLVVDLSAPVAVSAALAEAPDRLVIDMPEVNVQVDPAVGRLDGRGVGLIRAFRFGSVGPGRSRLVADLAGPAALRRAAVSSIAGGAASRLVVELGPSDPAAFHAAARPPAPAAPAPGAAPPAGDGRPTVVIDPGHGGLDPGASGPGGILEKDVVLRFAAALDARLSAGGRYRVVMTRRDDSFVSLGDRVRAAQEGGADLFLSIHADTLSDGAVSGATVYAAADRPSDAEAARVAASENAADAAAGLDAAPAAAGVSDVLSDLTRRETRTYAHQFQRTLAGYWAKVAHLNHNPERSAGFKVLQAPDVPSVLLELGYLSNGEDARALASEAWRARAAEGVAASVDSFFASRTAAAPRAGPPGPGAMR